MDSFGIGKYRYRYTSKCINPNIKRVVLLSDLIKIIKDIRRVSDV